MQLGVTFPQTEIGSDPSAVRDFAQAAEELGYDYLLAYDHVLGADPAHHTLTGPYTHESMFHEVFVLFGYLAALTERIQLMAGVLILPQRQTALVAKQAAEVDVLSGGRLILGVGIGWNQVEYASLGEDFHTRGRRVEEQVSLLRQLWEEPLVTFEGRFDRVQHAGINPLPQRRIPIWMGGSADPVLDRIGRMGDGWLIGAARPVGGADTRGAPNQAAARFPALERIRGAAREAGRDPSAISFGAAVAVTDQTVDQQVEQARAWREIGATHCSLNPMNAGLSPRQHIDAIRAFAEAAAELRESG